MFIVVAMLHQVIDVNPPVLAPTAVDVGRPGTLSTLDVTRQAFTPLGHRDIERLQVTRRVDQRTVVDAFSLEGPVPLADCALGAVC